MIRHDKFANIERLDNELDLIVSAFEAYKGKVVKTLPPIAQTLEGATFHIKQNDGTYRNYKKIKNKYKVMTVDNNAFVIWVDVDNSLINSGSS